MPLTVRIGLEWVAFMTVICWIGSKVPARFGQATTFDPRDDRPDYPQ